MIYYDRNIHIVGKGRLVLTPTMKSLPLVGGVQFFFLHIPNLDFEFEGLANVADLPVLKDMIRKSIEKVILMFLFINMHA